MKRTAAFFCFILWFIHCDAQLSEYFERKLFVEDTYFNLGYNYTQTYVGKTSDPMVDDGFRSIKFPSFSVDSYNKSGSFNYFFMDLNFYSKLMNMNKPALNEYAEKARFSDRMGSFSPLFSFGDAFQIKKFPMAHTYILLGAQYKFENSGMALKSEIIDNQYPLIGDQLTGSGAYIKSNRSWYGLNIDIVKTLCHYCHRTKDNYFRSTLFVEYTPSNTGGFRLNPELAYCNANKFFYIKAGYIYNRFLGVTQDDINTKSKFWNVTNEVKPVEVMQVYLSVGAVLSFRGGSFRSRF